nr:ribonuclease H-like domain, reverse transcriptase, RNA-dependent DNA polymerase [Tanacetum cinerariifolium]
MSVDVTRLQALVDKKKVPILKAVIRGVLRLDDAERSLSAKRTSWNEFSFAMASAIICLSTGRKFNFSKYIFDSLVRNVDSSSKFYMYPRFIQLIIQNQLGVDTPLFEGMLVVGEIEEHGDEEEQDNDNDSQGADADVSRDDVQDHFIPSPAPPTPPPSPQAIPSTSHVQSLPPQPQSPTPTQPHGADFSMRLLQEALDACAALTRRVEHLEHDKVAQNLEITKLKASVKKLERANKDVINQGRMIDELDRDEGVALMGEKEEEKKAEEIDMDHPSKVLSMHEEESTEVQQVVEVVTTAKLITEVVTTASTLVSSASIIIPAAEPKVSTAAPVKVAAASTGRRRGVVIRDPKEESTAITPADTKSKDKEHVKQKAKEDPFIQTYQVMKKRPQTEAQARMNMITYLKNTDGFRLDYFKGKSYDDIRLIFEAKFNANIDFLLKSKEQIEEEENRALESINETPAQKAAKQRRLNKEDKDVDEIK